MRNLRVAVDIGGTFTDLVAYDEDTHELTTVKTPSTPPGFIDGVMNALDKAGIQPGEVTGFKHGSTIATTAIIERRGAETGLVTTKGMRDVLGAGRANRPDLFNSNWDPSPPLVRRRNVITVDERIDYERRPRRRPQVPQAQHRVGRGRLPELVHGPRPREAHQGDPARGAR